MNPTSPTGRLFGRPGIGKQQTMVVLSIAILAALLVGGGRLVMPELLQIWEGATYDLRMQWRGAGPTSDHLVIIGRDSKSDEEFGAGIWNRAIFADLIAALNQAGARTIALDFHFSGVSPFGRGGAASDQRLTDAIGFAGKVLLPLPVSFAGEALSWPSDLSAKLTGQQPFADLTEFPNLPRVGQAVPPLPGLVQAAQGFGHIGAMSDSDGVYRRVPTLVKGHQLTIPAMGVAIAASFLQVPLDLVRLTPDQTLEFKGARFPDGTQRDLFVPVDGRGNMLLDYAGRWEDGIIQYFSFLDVWKTMKEPGGVAELRKHVSGKAVLILHATVESDKRRTPLDLTAPGGFIVANTFGTILTGGHLRTIPEWGLWSIVLVMALTAAWMVLVLPFARGVVAAGGLGVMYLIGVFEGFKVLGLVLPVLLPMAGLLMATGGALVWMSGLGMARIHKLVEQIHESKRHWLVLQQELLESQKLLTERQTYVQQLEGQLAAASTKTNAEPNLAEHVRGELEIELCHVRKELREREERIENLRASLEGAGHVREHLESELRQAQSKTAQDKLAVATLEVCLSQSTQLCENLKAEVRRTQEEEAKWRHAATRAQAQENSARVTVMGLNTFPGLSAQERDQLEKECAAYNIITRDPGMLILWRDFRKVAADRHLPILILGEPGTGKELFAQAAHKLSGLKDKNPVCVNMANIGDTAESALFGHEPGAFTGAVRRHNGYFLQANHGTIFLDEIGELSLNLQAKLLRVLENDEVWRMGAEKPESVKVRVVAATNRDLKQAIRDGKFRADLYSRLSGKVVRLPPLRERPDDIPELAQYFVKEEAKRRGYSGMMLSREALARLRSWRPAEGNLRELRQCMARAVVTATGSVIREQDLDFGETVTAVSIAAVSPVVLPDLDSDISSEDTRTVETVVQSVLDLPPFVSSDGTDDPRTNDEIFLRKVRECHFNVGKLVTTLRWDRSTVMHRLKGLSFQALAYTNRNIEAAASSLSGGNPVLKGLAEGKVEEYLQNLDKIIAEFPSQEEAVIGCQTHSKLKNLPKRYHDALASLVRIYFSQLPSLPLS